MPPTAGPTASASPHHHLHGHASRGHAATTACDAPRDPLPRLGVIGIFSHEARAMNRAAIRASWGRESDGLLPRFVMRGVGASEATREEARINSDVVFVNALANLTRSVGPLRTLMLWLECATTAWPAAQLVGKADDDVWAHLPGVAAHVRGSLDALVRRRAVQGQRRDAHGRPPLIYWGIMETYNWNFNQSSPIGFAYKYGRYRRSCKELLGEHLGVVLVGPFHFTKGPLFLLSAPLASQAIRLAATCLPTGSTYQVARSAEVVAEAERSISWTSRRRSIPWEDTFLGFGLAKVATSTEGHEPIAAVHAGIALYSEHQLYANATLIYHAQHAGPAFIGAAQARSFVRSVHRGMIS